MTEEKLMTAEEVAEYLQLNRQTVTRLAARGELPGVKIGREWRFRRKDLEAYLDAQVGKEPALASIAA